MINGQSKGGAAVGAAREPPPTGPLKQTRNCLHANLGGWLASRPYGALFIVGSLPNLNGLRVGAEQFENAGPSSTVALKCLAIAAKSVMGHSHASPLPIRLQIISNGSRRDAPTVLHLFAPRIREAPWWVDLDNLTLRLPGTALLVAAGSSPLGAGSKLEFPMVATCPPEKQLPGIGKRAEDAFRRSSNFDLDDETCLRSGRLRSDQLTLTAFLSFIL